MGASDAKRSWPAVSQISNFMVRVGRLHFWVRKAAACELALVRRQRDISEVRVRGWSASMEMAKGRTHRLSWAPCFLGSRCSQSALRVKTARQISWCSELSLFESRTHTFPTAASPKSTSFTLLLGFGAEAPESAIVKVVVV